MGRLTEREELELLELEERDRNGGLPDDPQEMGVMDKLSGVRNTMLNTATFGGWDKVSEPAMGLYDYMTDDTQNTLAQSVQARRGSGARERAAYAEDSPITSSIASLSVRQ